MISFFWYFWIILFSVFTIIGLFLLGTISYCNYYSTSHSSLYGIHYTFLSILVSSIITNSLLCFWSSSNIRLIISYFTIYINLYYSILLFIMNYINSDYFKSYYINFHINCNNYPLSFIHTSYFTSSLNHTTIYINFNLIYIFIYYILLVILSVLLTIWIKELCDEFYSLVTYNQNTLLVIGIKLLLLSELTLFFACFWCYINFRLIGLTILLCYFPLLSCYSFSISITNLLVLLFSSLPIQCSVVIIKTGLLSYLLEGLGQSISSGFYFIILQCKEYLLSYFSITDCLIGSIYYFTTGLHGFHVLIGLALLLLLLLFLSIRNSAFFTMESSFSLFISSYYWHFIDFIWLVVFILLFI